VAIAKGRATAFSEGGAATGEGATSKRSFKKEADTIVVELPKTNKYVQL